MNGGAMTLSRSRDVFSKMLFANKVLKRDVEVAGLVANGTYIGQWV